MNTRPQRPKTRLLAAGIAAAFLLTACGGGGSGGQGEGGTAGGEEGGGADAAAEQLPVTIYSGRNESAVGPLLLQIEEATGVPVEVRYGDSAELAAQILEEGDRTPADIYFGQDAGGLGALAGAGRLAELPAEILDVVDEGYRADDGTWVATSARARVVAYDSGEVDEADLPQSYEDLLDPQWEGQIGYPPTNGSWQTFVTGARVTLGEDEAREWLTGIAASDPVRFSNNRAVLDGIESGEVQLGLVNHYYILQRIEEFGADAVDIGNHYVGGGDPLALVNVTGAGVLADSDAPEAAQAVVEYLVSEEVQQYFADENAEYPVRDDVTSTVHDLPPISELQNPDVDLAELGSLEETLMLLQETGLA